MDKLNMKIPNLIFSVALIFTSVSLLGYERIPNEQFACYSNFNKMMVSPDGRYLLIRNTVKNNECDVEKEKEKGVEDEMYDRGLLLLDLDSMETTMLSDGSDGGGVSDAGWLSSNRIWYTPRYQTGKTMKSMATFAMNIDGTRRTIIKEGG